MLGIRTPQSEAHIFQLHADAEIAQPQTREGWEEESHL